MVPKIFKAAVLTCMLVFKNDILVLLLELEPMDWELSVQVIDKAWLFHFVLSSSKTTAIKIHWKLSMAKDSNIKLKLKNQQP